jgi:hypothetical protein
MNSKSARISQRIGHLSHTCFSEMNFLVILNWSVPRSSASFQTTIYEENRSLHKTFSCVQNKTLDSDLRWH